MDKDKKPFPAEWVTVQLRTKLGPDLSHIWKDPEVQKEIGKIPLTENWYRDASKYCQEHNILPCDNLVVYDLVKLQIPKCDKWDPRQNFFNSPIIKKYNSPEMLDHFCGWDEGMKFGIRQGYILLPCTEGKHVGWIYVGEEQARITADPNITSNHIDYRLEFFRPEQLQLFDDDIAHLLHKK
jgi:hypothetical protein